MLLGVILVEDSITGLQRERAGTAHRIPCIHREIDQRSFQLAAIGECVPEVRSQRLLDADAGTQGSAQQFGHAANDVVEVDNHGLQRLFPGKREQPMGQFTAAPCRPQRIVEVFASFGIAARALSQELQIADDDGKKPAGIELAVDLLEQRLGQPVRRRLLAEAPDRRMVGHALVQRQTGEAAKRQPIVHRLLHVSGPNAR